jgi:hypothetical protein
MQRTIQQERQQGTGIEPTRHREGERKQRGGEKGGGCAARLLALAAQLARALFDFDRCGGRRGKGEKKGVTAHVCAAGCSRAASLGLRRRENSRIETTRRARSGWVGGSELRRIEPAELLDRSVVCGSEIPIRGVRFSTAIENSQIV